MSMVRDLIEYLASKVVDTPGSVSVEAHGERDVTYLIRVAEGEEGRVIGRGGRVIQAIRTLARAAAGPRERVQVDVVSGPSHGEAIAVAAQDA
ncbi:MAG TPA: KH domain-containing protein [Deinococcales bacterium]|nr:KH domain-containing protein [Deinococcales bacterium]